MTRFLQVLSCLFLGMAIGKYVADYEYALGILGTLITSFVFLSYSHDIRKEINYSEMQKKRLVWMLKQRGILFETDLYAEALKYDRDRETTELMSLFENYMIAWKNKYK